MADYQGDVSGLTTTASAEQAGQSQGNSIAQGFDLGANLQSSIARTQMMKQELQQKMQENHYAMVNHVADGFSELVTKYDSKSPMWKFMFDENMKKAQQIGFPIEPDAMKAYLLDPSTRDQFASAMGQLNDPKMSAADKAQALQHAVYATGKDPSEIVKLHENMLDAQAKVMAAGNKVTNTLQSRADKIRDQVKGINSKWDTTEQFTDNALNILSNDKLVHSGPGQTLLQEAYTRSGSGSAIRSFTLQLGQDNRSLSNKMMGAIDKLDTGAKLQPDELAAMDKGLKIFKSNANKYRDNETSPYYNGAKSIVTQAQAGGYDIQSNHMIPDDQWARFENKETQKNEPKSQPEPKAIKSKSSVSEYNPGSNGDIDSFVSNMISNKATLQQVNKILSRKNMHLSQESYSKMAGQ